MKAELFLITERFPELRSQIVSQYERDEEFQALCLDYFLCLRSLEKWELDIKQFKERQEEYEDLKRMLEDKMLQHVGRDK